MSSYLSQITEPLIMQTYGTCFCNSCPMLCNHRSERLRFSRRGLMRCRWGAHSGCSKGWWASNIHLFTWINSASFFGFILSFVIDLNSNYITWLIFRPSSICWFAEDLGILCLKRLFGSAISSFLH